MSSDIEYREPPNDPKAFESLCRELFAELWGDPGTQKNGRSGQKQAGVDVVGREGGVWVGVQCKQKSGALRHKLTVKQLEAEVEKAKAFKPPLGRFLVATTGANDEQAQERAREITDQHSALGLFTVEVWSWQELWPKLRERQPLFNRLFPIYWPAQHGARAGVPRVAPTQLRHTAPRLFGRQARLADLEAAWQNPATHVVTLVAFGGVGKTSLVAAWGDELAARDYDGARYFDWSFYSQGSSDQSAATGELFVNAALRFFGDATFAESPASGWDKGARLAELVRQERTLLVLDGLEPLQYPPESPVAGEIKDPAVRTLLKSLAQQNPGLCVVTTRVNVPELAGHPRTAPEWELEALSTPAGVELVQSLGVHGAERELEALVEEVQGHALTLHLVGSYLHRAHGGDVRRRDLIDWQRADARIRGGHAFKAMAAYERWLAQGGAEGERQLAVLRLLGLFDRPADAGCVNALRQPPAIPHLTEHLVNLEDEDWRFTLTTLADHHLLSLRPPPLPGEGEGVWGEGDRGGEGPLDAHPLLREYFAHQLKTKYHDAWQAGHQRLYEHLITTTEYRPSTLAGLQPLYQAVAHGCQAGWQQRACEEMYWGRILRGTAAGGTYSLKQLGAFGADLGALAQFFDKRWRQVSPALSTEAQAWLLNEAGFRLRALGRLNEALEPMRAGLEMRVREENWEQAAISGSNLTAIQLVLGKLPAAQLRAEQADTYADLSESGFQRVTRRAEHADVLFQAGRLAEALARFEEAEILQAKRQATCPRLYSFSGFLYCDLLLAEAERAAWGRVTAVPNAQRVNVLGGASSLLAACQTVETRASECISWHTAQNPTLDIALDHLTLARATLYRAVLTGVLPSHPDFELHQAVDGLRKAGDITFVPRGLLIRALHHHLHHNPTAAKADLDEAFDIASRGPMPLHLADIALHRARLFRDRVALTEARRLIDKHFYGRRLPELEDAERAAAFWSPAG